MTWEQAVAAAQMWAGPGSAASGLCAAALWELGNIQQGLVEITTPRSLQTPVPWLKVRRVRLQSSEIRRKCGIALTSPERTLLDLGAVVRESVLEAALDDALNRRLTTLDRLNGYLEERGSSGRAGTAPLKKLTKALTEGKGTDRFERLLFNTLKDGGLPKPVAQHHVVIGNRNFYLDFAYPRAHLGIEAHSYRYHSERNDWEKDYSRHSLLTSAGWTLTYVTWRRLHDEPEAVVEEIKRALDRFERLNDNKLAF